MKNALPFGLMLFCAVAFGQSELGPLASSSTIVYSSGFAQFEKTMEAGMSELGQGQFIRLIYLQGLQVATIPKDVTPEAVTANRYDRILNPRLKTSLLRVMGDAVIQKTMKQNPPTLPRDPLLISVFVATATDTYSANRAAKLRAKIETIQEPISFGNQE